MVCDQLCITLRYLVVGESKVTIASSYWVLITTTWRIKKQTCKAICTTLLKSGHVKAPWVESDWIKIAKDFEWFCSFPNCIGAIDGRHIIMQAWPRSWSAYFNYKNTHSIVLMTVCNDRSCCNCKAPARTNWFSFWLISLISLRSF